MDYFEIRARRSKYSYQTKPRSIVFPHAVARSESRRHTDIRMTLFQAADLALGNQANVGTLQPIYWNAACPDAVIVPDVVIQIGQERRTEECIKTWQTGAPHVVVEIVGDVESSELAWKEKLNTYHQLGVEELVRFDPVAVADYLRVWDRVDNNLIERQLSGVHIVESAVLGLFWVVVSNPGQGNMLRLAKASDGTRMLPTLAEFQERKLEQAEEKLRILERQLRRAKKKNKCRTTTPSMNRPRS